MPGGQELLDEISTLKDMLKNATGQGNESMRQSIQNVLDKT